LVAIGYSAHQALTTAITYPLKGVELSQFIFKS